jgi:hypothetical protein
MKFDYSTVRASISSALQASGDFSEVEVRDVAFHMTDWLRELEGLINLYQSPGAFSASETEKILADFLIHAPAHIAAAAKLFTGNPVADVFEIGAVG